MPSNTFETWLLIPGNHRIILQVKKQITKILNKPIKIDSWRALYEYFEIILNFDLSKVNIFTNIFAIHPPRLENGATNSQIELFEQYSTC